MAFWRKEIKCGKVTEIEKYYSYNVHPKNIVRAPKNSLTSDAQKKSMSAML